MKWVVIWKMLPSNTHRDVNQFAASFVEAESFENATEVAAQRRRDCDKFPDHMSIAWNVQQVDEFI